MLIPSLYAAAPVSTRCFLWLRQIVTPYEAIAASLPPEGRVLDLGCGHGLLAFTAAIARSGRDVVGVDHDLQRILLARAALKRLQIHANLRFEVADLTQTVGSLPSGSLSGIAMIDMLHYFDPDAQESLVRNAQRVLRRDGVLAVREIDAAAGLRGSANRLYERLATGTGFTQSSNARLCFRTANQWAGLLQTAGFEVESRRCGLPFLADVLFVGRKPL